MKLQKIIGGLILLSLIFIILAEMGFAKDEGQKISLEKGKNYVTINNTIYVQELIRINPEIESISYIDSFLNQSIGYVNVFGGVGKNFVIVPEQVYEISVKKNMSLIIEEFLK